MLMLNLKNIWKVSLVTNMCLLRLSLNVSEHLTGGQRLFKGMSWKIHSRLLKPLYEAIMCLIKCDSVSVYQLVWEYFCPTWWPNNELSLNCFKEHHGLNTRCEKWAQSQIVAVVYHLPVLKYCILYQTSQLQRAKGGRLLHTASSLWDR